MASSPSELRRRCQGWPGGGAGWRERLIRNCTPVLSRVVQKLELHSLSLTNRPVTRLLHQSHLHVAQITPSQRGSEQAQATAGPPRPTGATGGFRRVKHAQSRNYARVSLSVCQSLYLSLAVCGDRLETWCPRQSRLMSKYHRHDVDHEAGCLSIVMCPATDGLWVGLDLV